MSYRLVCMYACMYVYTYNIHKVYRRFMAVIEGL